MYIIGLSKIYAVLNCVLQVGILLFYFYKTKRINYIHLLIIGLQISSEFLLTLQPADSAVLIMLFRSISYLLLFYFLYQNHKSFNYNIWDLKILGLSIILYTFIFVFTIYVFQELANRDLWSILLNLSLLYVLLIITGMHYINIRSVKSLYFFLATLYFTIDNFAFILDHFYNPLIELQIIHLFCQPFGLLLLVNYLIYKYEFLKAEEFEGF